MMVTAVIPVDKRKSKVFLEEGFAFVLYRGEVERYRIEDGRELEEGVYEEILRDILRPRSKEYALHLLKDSGKTEKWMKEKLGKAGYPKEAVEYAVNFLKEYHSWTTMPMPRVMCAPMQGKRAAARWHMRCSKRAWIRLS